ncbi:hypothetical protein HHX47_DHR3000939 [Lentinula edodes]|nr:hypothetical protein HHX47_DHR3000939 [Lentinula edodes]
MPMSSQLNLPLQSFPKQFLHSLSTSIPASGNFDAHVLTTCPCNRFPNESFVLCRPPFLCLGTSMPMSSQLAPAIVSQTNPLFSVDLHSCIWELQCPCPHHLPLQSFPQRILCSLSTSIPVSRNFDAHVLTTW